MAMANSTLNVAIGLNNEDEIVTSNDLMLSGFRCRKQDAVGTAVQIILLLQEMLGFKTTVQFYKLQKFENTSICETNCNKAVDIYAGHEILHGKFLQYNYPLIQTYSLRTSFVFRDVGYISAKFFYLQLLKPSVWILFILYLMLFAVSFRILHRTENKILKPRKKWEDDSFIYGLLFVISSCCQMSLPVRPRLLSRQIAYVNFFVLVLLVYIFFSSNIVSSLLNSHKAKWTLRLLAESQYICGALRSTFSNLSEDSSFFAHNGVSAVAERLAILHAVSHESKTSRGKHSSITVYPAPLGNDVKIQNSVLSALVPQVDHNVDLKYLRQVKRPKNPYFYVNRTYGVKKLKTESFAFFSEYNAIHNLVETELNPQELCALTSMEIYPTLHKALWMNRTSPYKEALKRSAVWLRETGHIRKVMARTDVRKQKCASTYHVYVGLTHIYPILLALVAFYFISLAIMALEILFYKKHIVPVGNGYHE